MDPVGPWYAYNRITVGGATGTFQTTTPTTTSDFVSHHLTTTATQAVPSTTTSQLLLQAAHTTATLAGQPSPFNPGGFLSPPPMSYDVFTPLFSNAKQAHYVSQHRQTLVQAQTVSVTKQNTTTESNIPVLRENYSTAHQATFFEQQGVSTSPTASTLAWTHPNNTQLPSPFGILPHESVVPSSPGTPSTKSSGTGYENTFNTHFNTQTINSINASQLTSPSACSTTDFKTSGCPIDAKKLINVRPQSPTVSVKSIIPTSQASSSQTFFHQVPTTFSSENLTNTYLSAGNGSQSTAGNGKVQPSLQHQQSCIVSTPSNNASGKEYRIPQPPSRSTASMTVFLSTSVRSGSTQAVQDKQGPRNGNFTSPPNKAATNTAQQNIQSKTQTKIYPELGSHGGIEHRRNEQQGHDNSQSSPISFSMMDNRNLNYATNNTANCNNTSGKLTNNQRTSSNSNLQSHPQQQQQQQTFHVLNQQQQQQQQQQTTNYRHYLTGSTSDTEYHHPGRSKSATSTDSAYSSNTSQNGPDCSVVVPRRPSPLQAHSQASPLGHVPSPAYPLYNSPIATMSSPSPLQQHTENNSNQCASGTSYKGGVQQQVTPPSPLDVTVPRPASQGQVAYSSVITRALGTTENKTAYNAEGKTYDRQQQDFSQTQKQQVCWEDDNRQTVNGNRKFAVAVYSGTNATTAGDMNAQSLPIQQQVQRLVNITDRQQPYFEANQVALQDLSSCRGDPMSIVKNLQTLQQNPCQVQQHTTATMPTNTTEQQKQVEERRKADSANKKRKSLEKSVHNTLANELTGTATMTEYLNRIPPPAHHNAVNQQQQNGYFEFERWPPSPAKMFPTASGAFSSQSSLHHSTNFVGTPAHQHQTLMVSHHHAPPPLPYFPAFHIPAGHHPHHPHEFQSSVEITPIGFENTTNQNTNYNQEVRDDQPKVIVPNIEEELGFLQQDQQLIPSTNQMNKDFKRPNRDPNTGFMTSYLKFLQGERDPSPPPAIRGGRKATWNRSKPYIPVESNKPTEALINGETNKPQEKPVPIKETPVKETPVIDYANDPRYFPLPKERKKLDFNSSDDGFTSDDDFLFAPKKTEKKVQNASNSSSTEVVTVKPEGKGRKGRPIKPGGPTDRKRRAAAAAAATAAAAAETEKKSSKKAEEVDPLLLPPRRETSRRKAKEKTSVKQFLDRQQGIDYFDNDEEQVDSDSDPAWTPAVKLVGEEEEKRKKRGRPAITKKIRKILEEDEYSSGEAIVSKKSTRKKHDMSSKNSNSSGKVSSKNDETPAAAASDEDIDISPFKHSVGNSEKTSGEFVVIKTDLIEEYPPLWRIDGKTLLQKYEPFKSNGKTLYRNISTYSAWVSQNRHIYQQVPVKFWQQGKIETIVEFLRDEMIIDNSENIVKSMKDTEKYQDNFEVYIQTLISQALDSNFLTEILQEQDDYFLSNVKIVDEVTEERKRRLLFTTKWKPNVVTAISTWPCVDVLKDLPLSEYKGKSCAGCQQTKIYARVLLYGQPYNSTTLEGSPPDPRASHDKAFLLCRICQKKVALYNKVAHQKYLMFLECTRRVAEKRAASPHKDTTKILNELLADESWLNQLFKETRSTWAEIDSMEQQVIARAKPKAALLSSTKQYHRTETTVANDSTVLTSKESANTSESQVPMQNIENNPQTACSNDVKMGSELS